MIHFTYFFTDHQGNNNDDHLKIFLTRQQLGQVRPQKKYYQYGPNHLLLLLLNQPFLFGLQIGSENQILDPIFSENFCYIIGRFATELCRWDGPYAHIVLGSTNSYIMIRILKSECKCDIKGLFDVCSLKLMMNHLNLIVFEKWYIYK